MWLKIYFVIFVAYIPKIEAFNPRIVGGIFVDDRQEFAYQASLREDGQHVCGATIIDSRHVLTASHCVTNFDTGEVNKPSKYSVVVGNLRTTDETILKSVKNVFTHDDYDVEKFKNDIALLRIEDSFTFTPMVNSIPIIDTTVAAGTPCNISGWGVVSEESTVLPPRLMYTSVPIVSQDTCNEWYKGDLYPGMICAGFALGRNDSCQGDSGGPLVCDRKLTGVVSWGYGCGRAHSPGVYTDIYRYRDWISEQIKRSDASKQMFRYSIMLSLIIVLLAVIY